MANERIKLVEDIRRDIQLLVNDVNFNLASMAEKVTIFQNQCVALEKQTEAMQRRMNMIIQVLDQRLSGEKLRVESELDQLAKREEHNANSYS